MQLKGITVTLSHIHLFFV